MNTKEDHQEAEVLEAPRVLSKHKEHTRVSVKCPSCGTLLEDIIKYPVSVVKEQFQQTTASATCTGCSEPIPMDSIIVEEYIVPVTTPKVKTKKNKKAQKRKTRIQNSK